jgi:thiamine-phosphate pyrophosphorylase
MPMKSNARHEALRGLYAITPEARDSAWLVARVAECIDGGAAVVQYRAKEAAPALALEQARLIAQLCRARRVPLIVNDSVELAIAVGAQGVHLGREDADVRSARAAFRDAIIGVSCYDEPRLARTAAEAGADYVAIGSVFASRTKPGARRAPLDSLAAAAGNSGLPVAAIGGITLENAPRAIAAGADMVAVITALFDTADVRAAARSFARLFEASATGNEHVRAQPRAF